MKFLEAEFGRLGVGLVGFCMNGTGRDSAAFRELLVGGDGEVEERVKASAGYWRRVGVLVEFLSWCGVYRGSFFRLLFLNRWV
jgi:hypothetical protein